MKNTYLTLFATVLLCSSTLIKAQVLPKFMTEEEKKVYPEYLKNIKAKGITTPPHSKVRTPAEWEEMDGIVISWQSYNSVLKEIVRCAKNECVVHIVCSDSASVKSYLTSNGIAADPSRIKYIVGSSNSVWIRDYGPNSVYTNDVDSLLIVDWIYNRPRPQDDAVPSLVGQKLNIPVYQTLVNPNKLINTGGNFMSDGFGNAFCSKLVVDENPEITSSQIDTIVKKFMGIERYTKMNNLPYDGIHHIDMHIKLLNEETLLVGQYPTGIADGPQIESNLNYVLNNFNSVFGTQYKVVRIPMPADNGSYPNTYGDYWTYTNSLIINKTVLVPIYNCPSDTTALRIYREAMPGYNVVGINCLATIPASGAIHCITKEIGAADPLLVSHQSLSNRQFNKSIEVSAIMKHRSGIASANLFYSVDGSDFVSTPMVCSDSAQCIWTGLLPVAKSSSHFKYYFEAVSVSGKTRVHPLTAPEGFYSFTAEFTNLIPIANAGYDQTVFENDLVSLDASLSNDPEGIDLQYAWKSLNGIQLTDTSIFNPEFIAPETEDSTILQFTVRVFDGFSWSANDTVNIIVNNTVGIEIMLIEEPLYITPNPNNGTFKVIFYAPQSGFYEVQIVNALGLCIFQTEIYSEGGTVVIPVCAAPGKGFGVVKIKGLHKPMNKKIIIK